MDERRAKLAPGRWAGMSTVVASILMLTTGSSATAGSTANTTERASVASDGSEALPGPWDDRARAFRGSFSPSITPDGRYVAFISFAPNLVAGDTNQSEDVFVRDRVTGQTERVSLTSTGAEASGTTYSVSISADGRYVAFDHSATLVPLQSRTAAGDRNKGGFDVFVHDRATRKTSLVSIQYPTQVLDYTSDREWVHSLGPIISGDGRFVAFTSNADNLNAGGSYRNEANVFVHDRQTGQTTWVNRAPDGWPSDEPSYAEAISADGRHVVFSSRASNLGPGDTNRDEDVFLYDRITGTTEGISVSRTGALAGGDSFRGTISANGRYVAFVSGAPSLTRDDLGHTYRVYVRDRQTGTTEHVSVTNEGEPANGFSWMASISPDGRYVAFSSSASNLSPGDTNGMADVFLHDRVTGRTELLSVSSDGGVADGGSGFGSGLDAPYILSFTVPPASVSAGGRQVAFHSAATNLVTGDTNRSVDVFVRHVDVDEDADGVLGSRDNCPTVANADQSDLDDDTIGDLCDSETTIGIDVKPEDRANVVNPRSHGVIEVAALTARRFDATALEPGTLCFGDAEGGERACRAENVAAKDVDGDGDLDLVARFRTQETGIDAGDGTACLTGVTRGVTVTGCDRIQTV